jgi:phosphinothricin acetyltransferase
MGVHTSVGFKHVGIVSGCGWKFERWLDVVLMQCPLGVGDRQPPV